MNKIAALLLISLFCICNGYSQRKINILKTPPKEGTKEYYAMVFVKYLVAGKEYEALAMCD
jgi:hypothetical protein